MLDIVQLTKDNLTTECTICLILFFLFNDNLTLVFRRELTFLLPVFVSQFLQVLFVFSPSPFFPPSPCNEKIKIK